MKVVYTSLKEVFYFEPKVFGDERGFFMETYRKTWLEDQGVDLEFVQDNHSLSRKGTLRGLHYQIKQPQGKLIRVLKGEVFDVAVDMRRDSQTFGKWVGVMLSSENNRIMWVPPGFAHGFYVVSEEAEFSYKCTDFYAPEFERTLRWDDEVVGVDWPKIDGRGPILSDKDSSGTALVDSETFEGF